MKSVNFCQSVQVDLENLFFDWLKVNTYQPFLQKFWNYHQHYQTICSQMQRKNHKFIHGVYFDLFENIPKNKIKPLLIIDDSCEENLNYNQFVKKSCHFWVTHLSARIQYKLQLFDQSKLGRDVEL